MTMEIHSVLSSQETASLVSIELHVQCLAEAGFTVHGITLQVNELEPYIGWLSRL